MPRNLDAGAFRYKRISPCLECGIWCLVCD